VDKSITVNTIGKYQSHFAQLISVKITQGKEKNIDQNDQEKKETIVRGSARTESKVRYLKEAPQKVYLNK
jgi:hypothetical protein